MVVSHDLVSLLVKVTAIPYFTVSKKILDGNGCELSIIIKTLKNFLQLDCIHAYTVHIHVLQDACIIASETMPLDSYPESSV